MRNPTQPTSEAGIYRTLHHVCLGREIEQPGISRGRSLVEEQDEISNLAVSGMVRASSVCRTKVSLLSINSVLIKSTKIV